MAIFEHICSSVVLASTQDQVKTQKIANNDFNRE